MASDAERQEEEMEALSAIFADEFRRDQGCCEITLAHPSGEESSPTMTLRFHIPGDYPSTSSPTLEVTEAPWLPEGGIVRLTDLVHEEISSRHATALSRDGEGEVILFEAIEFVKEQRWLWEYASEVVAEQRHILEQQRRQEQQLREHQDHLEQQRQQKLQESVSRQRAAEKDRHQEERDAEAALLQIEQSLSIRHGESFTVRKSVFQGHLAPVKSADDVKAVMDVLLANRKIASATHNIMAYRISSLSKTQEPVIIQDCDDDGESAAGGRLLHMLQIMGVVDVVVVVSRWFGGVLLGPERFRHINNAGRQILVQCGYSSKEK